MVAWIPNFKAPIILFTRGWMARALLLVKGVGSSILSAAGLKLGDPMRFGFDKITIFIFLTDTSLFPQPMTHSSVISQNALAPHALELWFQNTLETHVFLDMIFENQYPEKYAAYKKAHQTATWRKSDPGPYLG